MATPPVLLIFFWGLVKHIVSPAVLIAALGTALHADWKIVTRTGDTSVVEYFKSAPMRTDSLPVYTSAFGFRSPPSGQLA
jgi:hypothetical protein